MAMKPRKLLVVRGALDVHRLVGGSRLEVAGRRVAVAVGAGGPRGPGHAQLSGGPGRTPLAVPPVLPVPRLPGLTWTR
ncbi:hypothetical protein CRUP_016152, partial [Coryphaenoides rupestris]